MGYIFNRATYATEGGDSLDKARAEIRKKSKENALKNSSNKAAEKTSEPEDINDMEFYTRSRR